MMSSREEHKGAGKPSADARISHHGHLPNYSARAWWGRVVTNINIYFIIFSNSYRKGAILFICNRSGKT